MYQASPRRRAHRREVWQSLRHRWSCPRVWVQGPGWKDARRPTCTEEYVAFPWILHWKMGPRVHQMS